MNHGALDTLIFRFDAAKTDDGTLPHKLHIYKEVDPKTTERPALERPFILITYGLTPGQNQPKSNSYQQPFRDLTRVLVYIETELTIVDGSTIKGGFDKRHQSAINFVSNFIRDNRSLETPAELLAAFGDGPIAVNPDNPPESHTELKDGYRSVFRLLLSYFTTTNDGLEDT